MIQDSSSEVLFKFDNSPGRLSSSNNLVWSRIKLKKEISPVLSSKFTYVLPCVSTSSRRFKLCSVNCVPFSKPGRLYRNLKLRNTSIRYSYSLEEGETFLCWQCWKSPFTRSWTPFKLFKYNALTENGTISIKTQRSSTYLGSPLRSVSLGNAPDSSTP